MKALSSVLVMIVLFYSSVACAQEYSLVILPFDGGDKKEQYSDLRQGFPDLLKSCFTPYSHLATILERDDLDKAVTELGVRFDAEMESKTLPNLSKMITANFIVSGSYYVFKDEISIQTNLYDTNTTALVGSATYKGVTDDMIKGCEDIAHTLASLLTDYLELPDFRVDETPKKTQHFLSGLGFYYGGECPKAMPEFMKVLSLDAQHYDARYWMGRCYEDLGLSNSALIEFKKLSSIKDGAKYHEVVNAIKELEGEE